MKDLNNRHRITIGTLLVFLLILILSSCKKEVQGEFIYPKTQLGSTSWVSGPNTLKFNSDVSSVLVNSVSCVCIYKPEINNLDAFWIYYSVNSSSLGYTTENTNQIDFQGLVYTRQ